MKKVIRLLEWLNNNQTKFSIQDLDNDEGNFLIQTKRYEFETKNYSHEIKITYERDGTNEPDIDGFGGL